MSRYSDRLPQLEADVFLTDGGIETTLIYDDGFELPEFAAFVLLDDPAGREALVRYYERYVEVARRDEVGIVLETPTWRPSPDWAAKLGYALERLDQANRAAVELLQEVRLQHETESTPIVISGCVGPQGDGYRPATVLSAAEAADYHARQINVLANAGVDLVTAITMTYPAEAIGVVNAAIVAEIPVVISFTVETDGMLPTGPALAEAIDEVDRATGGAPSYYMINCAHPSHFDAALVAGAPWVDRIRGLRANASRMSHAELDVAEELDAGNPAELAAAYRDLRRAHPRLAVLGGCCGTNHEHVGAISAACSIRQSA